MACISENIAWLLECPRVIHPSVSSISIIHYGASISLRCTRSPARAVHYISVKMDWVIIRVWVMTAKGCLSLGHSNWTICSPGNLFLKSKFPLFKKPHAAFPFHACRWKGTPYWTPKVNGKKGCMTLGHSNWAICSPRNLFLHSRFPLY